MKLAILFLLIANPLWAVTLYHTDTFSSGTVEGWAGGAAPITQLGGPAGAADEVLQISSNGGLGTGGHLATHNEEPVWLGNYSLAGVEAISLDLMVPPAFPALEIRMVLFGPLSFDERWTSTIQKMVPNDGVWRHYQFSLAEADLTHVAGTATYPQLSSDVISVMFRHDPGGPSVGGTAIVGRMGLDNIHLTACDFDQDGDCDIADLDTLTMAITGGSGNLNLDANGDGTLTPADVARWRLDAGFRNRGASYLAADANLDGVVDGTDFNVWNTHKFTATGKWSQGDFSVDGVTDGTDFNTWNGLKFTSSDSSTTAVPEPTFSAGLFILMSWSMAKWFRPRTS
ncbi:MAG TPA: hypothetical protein VIY86_09580 [Pirellulaceae bacterium]